MKYRRIVVSCSGNPEERRIVKEGELQEPKWEEVRVKILVAGVGFTDLLMREGTMD